MSPNTMTLTSYPTGLSGGHLCLEVPCPLEPRRRSPVHCWHHPSQSCAISSPSHHLQRNTSLPMIPARLSYRSTNITWLNDPMKCVLLLASPWEEGHCATNLGGQKVIHSGQRADEGSQKSLSQNDHSPSQWACRDAGQHTLHVGKTDKIENPEITHGVQ